MPKKQAMYLVRDDQDIGPCWEILHCPAEQRENCVVWEYEAGDYCWFVSGTFCQGESHSTWGEKMQHCQQCVVFKSMIPEQSDR